MIRVCGGVCEGRGVGEGDSVLLDGESLRWCSGIVGGVLYF